MSSARWKKANLMSTRPSDVDLTGAEIDRLVSELKVDDIEFRFRATQGGDYRFEAVNGPEVRMYPSSQVFSEARVALICMDIAQKLGADPLKISRKDENLFSTGTAPDTALHNMGAAIAEMKYG